MSVSGSFKRVALIGFGLIESMQETHSAMLTLSLVLVASVIAVLIAVPLGILAARRERVSRCLARATHSIPLPLNSASSCS